MSLRFPSAATEIDRPAAIPSIARAIRQVCPAPVPLALIEWL